MKSVPEKKINEIRRALIDFRESMRALDEAWEHVGEYGSNDTDDDHRFDDAINDAMSTDYPFQMDFREEFLEVMKWTNSADEALEGLLKREAESKTRRITDFGAEFEVDDAWLQMLWDEDDRMFGDGD